MYIQTTHRKEVWFNFFAIKKTYEKFHKTFNFKIIKFIIGYAVSVDKGLGFSEAKYNVLAVCKDDKNAFKTANLCIKIGE